MLNSFRSGHVTDLKPCQAADADDLFRWYYDRSYRFFFREFQSQLSFEELKDLGDALSYGGITLLVIVDKTTGKNIGLMTFVLEKRCSRVYKFGIMLDEGCQHKTYAIDAIVVLGDFLFRVKNAHKLVVEFCDEDKHIHRITQKGGFKHEATLKEEVCLEGIFFDEARYSLMRETFFELYKDFLP